MVNKEFLVGSNHQLTLTTSLSFVYIVRKKDLKYILFLKDNEGGGC